MDKIVCFKLISGEEVIGTLVEHNTLKDVAAVMMMPSQAGDGRVSLGLLPFLPYADDNKFTFAENSIVVRFEPNTDMVNNYNRVYGAGIQIAKSF